MAVLATTLHGSLAQADVLFDAGRLAQARRAYEAIVQRAQERADHAVEVAARAALARCELLRHDPAAARDHLDAASRLVELAPVGVQGRYREADVRVTLEEAPPERRAAVVEAYLGWAEQRGAHAQIVDACRMFADHGLARDRIGWLERAIDHARAHGVDDVLARTYNDLAVALDEAGRPEDSLDAYEEALSSRRAGGTPRQVAGAAWAVGAIAVRLEEWPLAEERLREAVSIAAGADDASDLRALALAELARVHEAAGDVVEARRTLLDAVKLCVEVDLPRVWPARWRAIAEHADALGLELDA